MKNGTKCNLEKDARTLEMVYLCILEDLSINKVYLSGTEEKVTYLQKKRRDHKILSIKSFEKLIY